MKIIVTTMDNVLKTNVFVILDFLEWLAKIVIAQTAAQKMALANMENASVKMDLLEKIVL